MTTYKDFKGAWIDTDLWVIFVVFFIFFSAIIFVVFTTKYRNVEVALTYCDNRKPDTVIVRVSNYPSNKDILNDRRAVPEYKNHFNVCGVETLREIK